MSLYRLYSYLTVLGINLILLTFLNNLYVNTVVTILCIPFFWNMTREQHIHRKILWRLIIFMSVVFVFNTFHATGRIRFHFGEFYVTDEVIEQHVHLLFLFLALFIQLFIFLTSARERLIHLFHQSGDKIPGWLWELIVSFSFLTEALAISVKWKEKGFRKKRNIIKDIPVILAAVYSEIKQLVDKTDIPGALTHQEKKSVFPQSRWIILHLELLVLVVLIVKELSL